MIITFIFSWDDIFRSVKQESSLLAERKVDAAGNSLFNQLVFDEEYEILFKKLFLEAQAYIDDVASAYNKGIPVDADYLETQDFSKERDYIIQLNMPQSIMIQASKAADIKIKQFLVDYIMYVWLRTKLPNEAEIYSIAAQTLLPEIKSQQERRSRKPELKGRWF